MSNPPVLRLGGIGPARTGPSLAAVRPDMDLLGQLVEMGFSVERASQALTQTENRLGAALDWLDQNPTWEIPPNVLNDSFLAAQPGYSTTDIVSSEEMALSMQQRETLGSVMPGITSNSARTSALPQQQAPSAVAIATLQAAEEPVGLISSRYDSNSKDAYRERKRQKEVEKARLEKQQQQQEQSRIKAAIAEEKARRLGVAATNTTSANTDAAATNTTSTNAAAAHTTAARRHEEGAPAAITESHADWEERQRLRAVEEARKQKLAEAAERERIKREIEQERAEKFGTHTDATGPKMTPSEQKAAYLEKQKEKQKEEWRVEQEANQKRLAELRRQLQEDKERKAALRAATSTTTSTINSSSIHTSSQASSADTQPRTSLPSNTSSATIPPAAVDSTATTSTAADPNTASADSTAASGPQKSVAEQLAEARRARLGITTISGTQAHATGPSYRRGTLPSNAADEDDNTTDVDVIKARNKARQQTSSQSTVAPGSTPTSVESVVPPTVHETVRDIHQKKYEEQRRKEQEEEERRKRAERAERMVSNTASLRAGATPSRVEKSKAEEEQQEIPMETSNPEIPQQPVMISVRLPDGRIKRAAFKPNDPISAVHKYAAAWLPLDSIFSLLIPTPRQEFNDQNAHVTLQEAGLCPRGTLTVLTLQNRGTVRQAPPRPANLHNIMHMMNYGGSEMEATEEYHNMSYEEMLQLQERIGSVPTGLNNREIAALPCSRYQPPAAPKSPTPFTNASSTSTTVMDSSSSTASAATTTNTTSGTTNLSTTTSEGTAMNVDNNDPQEALNPRDSDDEDNAGAFCVICQVDIEKDELIITLPRCNHIFHKDHIEQWLKDNRSCPACRQRVVVGHRQPPSDAHPEQHRHSEDNES